MTEMRTAQLAVTWGLSDRSVRKILGELTALGFELEVDDYGSRRVPDPLALAVGVYRDAGKPLAELVHEPDLQRYLRREADPLATTIELQMELHILREVMGELYRATNMDLSPIPLDWRGLGVPDPRRGL
jgi:hypothetical protein